MIPIGETAHVRTIRTSARRIGADELEVTGHLFDERPGPEGWRGDGRDRVIHDMTITIRVQQPALVITAVDGRMDERPYTLCTDAVPSLDRLIGLSVMQGFTRAVNERFGRQLGCAHMTALIQAMAPVVKQGAGAAFNDEDELPQGDQDLWFVNTCQAWREDGPLHREVRAGSLEGLRSFSARAPQPAD